MLDPSSSATEVAQESLRLLLAKDMTAYAGLWATDGVFELPFAAPGQPARIEGRDALSAHLAGYTALLDVQQIVSSTFHESVEPGVVVMEFEATGIVVPTGRAYRMSYIAVIRTRAGEIVSYRDYWSPAAAAEFLADVDTTDAPFAPEVQA